MSRLAVGLGLASLLFFTLTVLTSVFTPSDYDLIGVFLFLGIMFGAIALEGDGEGPRHGESQVRVAGEQWYDGNEWRMPSGADYLVARSGGPVSGTYDSMIGRQEYERDRRQE